jgi:hypothetical protein
VLANGESKDRLLSIADAVSKIIKGKVETPATTGEDSWMVYVTRANPILTFVVTTDGPEHEDGGSITLEEGSCTHNEEKALSGLANKANITLNV